MACLWSVVKPGAHEPLKVAHALLQQLMRSWLNRTYPVHALSALCYCHLSACYTKVSHRFHFSHGYWIAITGTHSQSYDLESRQPHLRRSGATAQLHVLFVKAKIRVHLFTHLKEARPKLLVHQCKIQRCHESPS